jgi:hypothetical protein
MKTSFAVVAALLVAGTATGASAIVTPYFGSDALFNVTNSAISSLSILPALAYVAGGSGPGQAAMVAKTQAIAPMSEMLTSAVCTFNDHTGAGLGLANASGIVIGLDAVDILATTPVIDTTACGAGKLAYSGTTGVFSPSETQQTWRWVLALLYGGKDYSTGVVDCDQPSRRNLVNNWSNLFQFQATCVNGNATCQALSSAGDGTHTPLWHAFRPDDGSGTADVFASVLGLSPSPSQIAVNGFGASPYCNALNWDVTSDASGTCALGNHDQFSGPGGMIDPLSQCTIGTSPVCGAPGSGNHRMPPLVPAPWNNNVGGVWGLNPNVAKAACNHQLADPTQCIYDVLPTDMQDNDPIRRPCQGRGKTGNALAAGEEVCNLDGALGLVLAIPSSAFIARPFPSGLGLPQYPSGTCGPLLAGNAPNVFTCAPANIVHSGECPNGDSLVGGQCSVPVLKGTGSSGSVGQVCQASETTVSNLTNRTDLGVAGGHPPGSPDGRAFNLHLYHAAPDGAITYIEQVLPNVVSGVPSPISRDFVGGMGRIHEFETLVGTAAVGCQELDVTDQIGCLVQADPCSFGLAGNGALTWNQRPNGALGVPSSPATRAASINSHNPEQGSTSLLYPMWRKLYLTSLVGFANVATENLSPANAPDPDELSIAEFESSYTANTNAFANILAAAGYFQVAANGPLGNAPFCEDFNEGTICGGVNAQNACATNVGLVGQGGMVPGETGANPLTAPTQSTVCGNGRLEAYEECDNGTANGTTGNRCSTTCRCVEPYVFVPAAASCL